VPGAALNASLPGVRRFEDAVSVILQSPAPKTNDMATKNKTPQAGLVVVSSDPDDDEATAAAAIVVAMGRETFVGLSSGGVIMAANANDDGAERDLEPAVVDALAVIVVLSRKSLESLPQMRLIMLAMEAAAVARDKGTPTPTPATWTNSIPNDVPPLEVIPMNTPSFTFPSSAELDDIMSRVMVKDQAAAHANLKEFFKIIAISLASGAPHNVLAAQVGMATARIPRHTGAAKASRESSVTRCASLGLADATRADFHFYN